LEQEKNDLICQNELLKLNFTSCEQKIFEYEKLFNFYKQMEIDFHKGKESKKELETKLKESLLKGKSDVNNVKKEIIKRDEQIQVIRKKFMIIIQEV